MKKISELLSGKKILILGGSGYVGRAFAQKAAFYNA